MSKENIELLATDISARVKYGVQVQLIENEETMERYKLYLKPYPLKPETVIAFINYNVSGSKYKLNLGGDIVSLEDCKPYLRSMSSMTEKEEKEYAEVVVKSQDCSYKNNESATTIVNDWYLSKGFDVRGLIPKGLALEAPKDMYKFELK